MRIKFTVIVHLSIEIVDVVILHYMSVILRRLRPDLQTEILGKFLRLFLK